MDDKQVALLASALSLITQLGQRDIDSFDSEQIINRADTLLAWLRKSEKSWKATLPCKDGTDAPGVYPM